MWNQICSFMFWLHDPEHVARFQQVFGVMSRTVKPNQNDNKINTFPSKVTNGLIQRHHQRKVTYDTNVLDECLEEINHSSKQKSTSIGMDYQITIWFWYYFFQLGSALGNEIFYTLFFPIWLWNVDECVLRQMLILWAIFMYVGQATKDILAMPRPSSPPVAQIEKRYIQEYGFPSTHAMFAVGIPLSLVLLSHQRYEFNILLGLSCVAFVWAWICLSRIYLGMHTFLDIIGGTLFTLILICILFPYVPTIDNFILNSIFSPVFFFLLGIFLIKCYPSLRQWSTARSDTTVILGSTIGFFCATNIMNQMGLLERSLRPLIYTINSPDITICILRTVLGLVLICVTREIVKRIILRSTCAFYGLDYKNPEIKRLARVEMPYYYLTYFIIGFSTGSLCPLIFRALRINRDYNYIQLQS